MNYERGLSSPSTNHELTIIKHLSWVVVNMQQLGEKMVPMIRALWRPLRRW